MLVAAFACLRRFPLRLELREIAESAKAPHAWTGLPLLGRLEGPFGRSLLRGTEASPHPLPRVTPLPSERRRRIAQEAFKK
jgi:hypothetical protein